MIWAACAITLDIFNSQSYMNLPAIILLGLVSLPQLFKNRTEFLGDPIFKALSVYFALLIVLGIYHGFISPWPDLTGQRSLKDQSQFRAILHLGRTFLEYCAILQLTLNLRKHGDRAFYLFTHTTFYLGLILCGFSVLEKNIPFDFYHFFTGGREFLETTRPRSLAYEPRGLSQNLMYCVLMLPFTRFKKWKYLVVPVLLFFACVYTISFTGVAVLIAGTALLLVGGFFLNRTRLKRALIPLGAMMMIATIGGTVAWTKISENSKIHLRARFDQIIKGDLASKFEVFDAAAINFFQHHPKHLVFGTGPGLVYLPASEYVIERDRPIWGKRFEALPHVGLILTLSNAGFVGIALFGTFLGLLVLRGQRSRSSMWLLGIALALLYLLQLRYHYLFGVACLWALSDQVKSPKRRPHAAET